MVEDADFRAFPLIQAKNGEQDESGNERTEGFGAGPGELASETGSCDEEEQARSE